MRYHLISMRIVIIKQSTDNDAGASIKRGEPTYTDRETVN